MKNRDLINGPFIVRSLLGIWGLILAGFFAAAVVARFKQPIELEWMSGAVLEHIARIRDGKPLYVEPTETFVPFLYPPLYYALVAAVAKFIAIPVAARIVSIVATFVALLCTAKAMKDLGASRFWVVLAPLLYLASYRYCGTWFDLERADNLLMAMVLGALVLLAPKRGLGLNILGAILAGGAFFAKQPGLVIGASLVATSALLGDRSGNRWRRGLVLVGVAVATFAIPYALLNRASDGWFTYYCVTMPRSHGIYWKLYTTFLVIDLSTAFFLTIGTIGTLTLVVPTALNALKNKGTIGRNRERILFAAALGAAFVTSALSRFHVGGYINVLLFWVGFAVVASCALMSRLDRLLERRKVPVILHIVLLLVPFYQLLKWTADPSEAMPTHQRVVDQQIVQARIRELEKDGDVVVHGRGGITKNPHFHIAALMDVLRAGKPVPKSLQDAIEQRRYAAYVIDEFGELSLEAIVGHRSELWALVNRYYFVAERFDDREPPPMVGWIAHPSWVYRPRAVPLTGATDAELEARLRIEMGLAESRMRVRQAGGSFEDRWQSYEVEAESTYQTKVVKRIAP